MGHVETSCFGISVRADHLGRARSTSAPRPHPSLTFNRSAVVAELVVTFHARFLQYRRSLHLPSTLFRGNRVQRCLRTSPTYNAPPNGCATSIQAPPRLLTHSLHFCHYCLCSARALYAEAGVPWAPEARSDSPSARQTAKPCQIPTPTNQLGSRIETKRRLIAAILPSRIVIARFVS